MLLFSVIRRKRKNLSEANADTYTAVENINSNWGFAFVALCANLRFDAYWAFSLYSEFHFFTSALCQ